MAGICQKAARLPRANQKPEGSVRAETCRDDQIPGLGRQKKSMKRKGGLILCGALHEHAVPGKQGRIGAAATHGIGDAALRQCLPRSDQMIGRRRISPEDQIRLCPLQIGPGQDQQFHIRRARGLSQHRHERSKFGIRGHHNPGPRRQGQHQ